VAQKKKSYKKMWMKSPSKCPQCNGEREWDGTTKSGGKPIAICHFCGRKE
jgi:hypothetical protein